MKNIVLIGMPGCGKSTVGVVLAKKLAYHFIDTDILLATKHSAKLPELIEKHGFDGFVKLEGKAGMSVGGMDTVVATGGSMVFSEEAMQHFDKSSVIVWIYISLDDLKRRLPPDLATRGVVSPGALSLDDIYAMRAPLYEKYAHIRVDTDVDIDSTSDKIIEAIKDLI